MVKKIAEEIGREVPGFFRYMLYSGCVLIPLFILITFIFFRYAAFVPARIQRKMQGLSPR